MDKIYLDKMAFYGYHGLFAEENKLGQRFYVDLVLELNLQKAGRSDQMEDSIDYGRVYQLTQEIVEGKAYRLIEAVAETIASTLLSNFNQLKACHVKVNKPDPPIPGHYQAVAVEIYRERAKMRIAYIALGSNIQPRFTYLQKAIKNLNQSVQLDVVQESPIYETVPVGYANQENFLNMVLKVETELTPFELLDTCQRVEQELGRKREFKWGPRTIDLDILLYNQENMETEQLIIPHPRIEERAFVLIPLLDVNPSGHIPSSNKSIVRALAELPSEEKRGVVKWIRSSGEEE